jgi:type I restriction enzyme S subunit
VKPGWTAKPVGSICAFSNGLWSGKKPPFVEAIVVRNTNFRPHGRLDTSDVALLDVEAKQLAKRQLKLGDIIIEKSGGGPKQAVGRVAYFDKSDGTYSFSNFTTAARVLDRSEVDPQYLIRFLDWCYIIGVTKRMQSHSTGIRNLDLNAYKAIEVPLPPLEEQRQIVGVLDEAFAAVATATANAEKNLANARALFDFALDKAIMGEVLGQEADAGSANDLLASLNELRTLAVAQGKAKKFKGDVVDGNPERFGDIPASWRWAQLESLTTGISDGVHKTPSYIPDGIPFVTVRNLTAGPGISFESLSYISKTDHDEYIKRTHPEYGDILISKDGTIGVVRRVETEIEFSIFVSVALIKPLTQELGRYLAYALSANCVQRQIVPQGTALKHLYLNDLRRMMIPLPSPKAQESICDRLDALSIATQELEDIYIKKLEALGTLKRVLLREAFSGELTPATRESIFA